jgi:hypothetical protein
VRDGGVRRFAAREGASWGMSGGVGSRVGGGVAMVEELGEEWCLRQPRMGGMQSKETRRKAERGKAGQAT